MQESENFQDLIKAKNSCLAHGTLLELAAGERMDVALQNILPFTRSEIQNFMQQPCLAQIDSQALQQELASYIACVEQAQNSFALTMLDIQTKQADLVNKFKDKLQFKPYKTSFKVKEKRNFFCLPPANLAVVYQTEAEPISLNIVYEDDYLLVIDKPKGLVVHPAVGNWHGTLLNGLLYYLKDAHPYLVHRIDKETSGLLVVAKTLEVQQLLQAQLKQHAIQRTYQALAWGHFSEEKFTIKGAIARDPSNPLRKTLQASGKAAVTHARLLEQFANFAYLELQLETGRTHQIRVHMAALQHPLLGDTLYGGASLAAQTETGQCLHAVKLCLEHPVTKELMEFTSPLPPYFVNILKLARRGEI